jgi:hypothetical protein
MGRWYVEGSVCNSVYSEFRVHEILCTQNSVYAKVVIEIQRTILSITRNLE